MRAFDAHNAFIRNDIELVRLGDIEGRIAMEGALPYPPGVYCIVPGEVWGGAVLDYFMALQEGVNSLPGFEPEVQGVYWETSDNGQKEAWAYVLKQDDKSKSQSPRQSNEQQTNKQLVNKSQRNYVEDTHIGDTQGTINLSEQMGISPFGQT